MRMWALPKRRKSEYRIHVASGVHAFRCCLFADEASRRRDDDDDSPTPPSFILARALPARVDGGGRRGSARSFRSRHDRSSPAPLEPARGAGRSAGRPRRPAGTRRFGFRTGATRMTGATRITTTTRSTAARESPTSGERAAADNDDAFYASSMDDEDERWVEKQRGGRVSDAILSCPCCLEIVTIDCQRHHRREGQYRAMFVRNVRVDASVALRPMDRDAKTDAVDAASANVGGLRGRRERRRRSRTVSARCSATRAARPSACATPTRCTISSTCFRPRRHRMARGTMRTVRCG